MDAEPKPISLYCKLAAIAGQITAVERDGRNKDQGYRYPTFANIANAVKPLMDSQKVAIIPHLVEFHEIDSGQRAGSGKPFVINRVSMHYHIVDGDSGEEMVVPWQGQAGTYGDDKGLAKAQTIALRTFLVQLFQIPAEDPEIDPDARDARQAAPPRQQQAKAPPSRVETEDIHEKRKRLAELRSAAVKARVVYKPPKSPGDMSALEVDAAINEIETLLGETAAAEF